MANVDRDGDALLHAETNQDGTRNSHDGILLECADQRRKLMRWRTVSLVHLQKLDTRKTEISSRDTRSTHVDGAKFFLCILCSKAVELEISGPR